MPQACRQYDHGTSILLLGMRGTGLSTLAFMAARALKYSVLDSEQAFHRITGMSRTLYKSTHGCIEYRRRELELLRRMLSENQRQTILVASLGAVQEAGQEHIAEYTKNHPVIYISRDAKAVQVYLKSQDIGVVTDLIRRSDPIYRHLSSFEFYNLCDTATTFHNTNRNPDDQLPEAPSLKQLEQDFIHLLQQIAFRSPPGEHCDLQPTPTCCPIESRQFTYLLPAFSSDWHDVGQKLKEIDLAADALELIFPTHDMAEQSESLDNTTAATVTRHFFSMKRHGRLPMVLQPQPRAISNDDQRISAHEQSYVQALHHGLKLCPEYLCVDLSLNDSDILKLVASKGSTKIIGDFHDHNPSPNGWSRSNGKDTILRGQRLGCDLARITQPATTMDDNFSVRQFAYECKTDDRFRIPVIVYNTGRLGRMSQFLNHHLSPVTDPVLSAGVYQRSLSKDLLTVHEAQAALYSSLVLDKLTFGIYGNEVAPSLSPRMHNAAFKFCGMPHEYKVFQHATLEHLSELLRKEDCGGFSITAPFKREVQQNVDSMSPEARAIGAINTVLPLRSKPGDHWFMGNRTGNVVELYGDNTDWAGIYVCVQRKLSPINAIKRNWSVFRVEGCEGHRHTRGTSIRAVRTVDRTESSY